ncbi:MAG: 5-oxoprolinase/urea amidolyase family protein [Acidimicrobiia bacterium]
MREAVIEVVDGGALTTIQDHPGRIGYWHVGVPPNGPMDDLSHRLVNVVVGNAVWAATLELTGRGPILRFDAPAVVAVGGAAMTLTVDGRREHLWCPIEMTAGSTLTIGAIDPAADGGLRAYLAVRGGFDVEPYLGSRSTFTLGQFGGHCGRELRAGDRLSIGTDIDGAGASPHPLSPGVAPVLSRSWEIGVVIGPHTAPEFFTTDGLVEFFKAQWRVHFNSARTGVRLVGPRPQWARTSGGQAGLHPSNIHDTGYAIGAVDITGDTPVILGPDGPSLGGFVCPAVVAAAERWKLGQLAPGDVVRLVPWTASEAEAASIKIDEWLTRASTRIEPVARPTWNAVRSGGAAALDTAVLDRTGEVTYRQAGDRFLLVEYGPMALDLELRAKVHALEQWTSANLTDGVIDVTAGIRSLLVQVDGRALTVGGAMAQIQAAQDDLIHGDMAFESRIVHLPLSWDDPSTRDAIQRYMHGVRPDAPWCPWNIEFIRRINGLDSVDDVHRIVFDADYLVLGLGDVYLGAPVATPYDPRHRLVTTKYNPARTWTPENAVGIGGAYLCIYGMEGPGGYQFVGRTVQVWNRDSLGPHFTEPWLLRNFDRIRFYPVEANELLELREQQTHGEFAIKTETTTFSLAEYRTFLETNADSIGEFETQRQAAFDVERAAWAASGELA